MGPGAGSTESEEPLRELRVEDKGHLETGGESEPPRYCRKIHTCAVVVSLIVVSSTLIAAIIALAVLASKLQSSDLCPPAGPACPGGWVGYRGKCYYFSETDGNWTYSRSHCSALNASLAGIDSEQEMAFLLRHKDARDHWIGLRRDRGQPWKWANGTKFKDTFLIRGGGDCAYLNDEKGVSSARCHMGRRWICSKPEVYVMGKGTALEGSLK